jgi:hypothetical protein
LTSGAAHCASAAGHPGCATLTGAAAGCPAGSAARVTATSDAAAGTSSTAAFATGACAAGRADSSGCAAGRFHVAARPIRFAACCDDEHGQDDDPCRALVLTNLIDDDGGEHGYGASQSHSLEQARRREVALRAPS